MTHAINLDDYDDEDPTEDYTDFVNADEEKFHALTVDWPTARKAAMLKWLQAQHARELIKRRYSHPAEIAKAVDPNYVMTPAIEVISRSVERVLTTPRINLLVTMPPQEGKSSLVAVWSVLRALQLDPDCRVILAAYGDTLAEDHSRECIRHILAAGTNAVDSLTGTPLTDKLGLQISGDRASVSGWKIEGGKGGLVSVGLGSSITGRPADLMIIDDPYKNMQEADSAAHRNKVENWMKSVAFTRLSPDASVILIQTRWHPEDLAGSILASEATAEPHERSWRHLNIPAVAEEGIPDALGREPGEAMVSARGRSPEQFAARRRSVGERIWYALYQGVPAPPGGDLFDRTWITNHRIDRVPEHTVMTVVAIDPAETGQNDEAGIVAGSLTATGEVLLSHDRSGHYTSDQWARRGVELALEVGAREIAIESYATATTYTRVVKNAYKAMHEDAVAAYRTGRSLTDIERRCLSAAMPFRIHQWRGKGDAIARSGLLRQGVETGKTRFVGVSLQTLEDQAVAWQSGQHQPDRLAAAVIVHDRLTAAGGHQASFGNPNKKPPPKTGGGWMSRKLG